MKESFNSPIVELYGYFLKGTGSAIYARGLTKALNMASKDILLFSQENEPEKFDFIQSSYIFENGALKEVFSRRKKYPGRTIHVKITLHDFLPVYVYDEYPGYKRVIEFADISQKELNEYLNVVGNGVRKVLEYFQIKPAGFIVHHVVPLPLVISKYFPDFQNIAVYHGSDLNYAALKSRLMFENLKEGLKGADYVVALAKHGKKDLLNSCVDFYDEKKVKIVPPGIDFKEFYVRESRKQARNELLEKLNSIDYPVEEIEKRKRIIERIKNTFEINDLKRLFLKLEKVEAQKITEPEIKNFIEGIKNNDKLIVFAGKYLWQKGPQTVILSLPLLFNKYGDNLKVILVGFGASRGILEFIKNMLVKKDYDLLRNGLLNHKKIDPGSKHAKSKIEISGYFIKKLSESGDILEKYFSFYRSRTIQENVLFAGYLDHRRLAPLLSAADIFVAPSQFSESFGLVIVEASACGVVPVATSQFGFKNTLETLSGEVEELKEISNLRLNKSFIKNLALNIEKAFKLPTRNILFRKKLFKAVEKNYNWEKSARRTIRLIEEKK